MLKGELEDIQHDSQLEGRFVNVLGKIKYLKDGNCFISFHLIEPKIQETLDDLFEDGEDDGGLF